MSVWIELWHQFPLLVSTSRCPLCLCFICMSVSVCLSLFVWLCLCVSLCLSPYSIIHLAAAVARPSTPWRLHPSFLRWSSCSSSRIFRPWLCISGPVVQLLLQGIMGCLRRNYFSDSFVVVSCLTLVCVILPTYISAGTLLPVGLSNLSLSACLKLCLSISLFVSLSICLSSVCTFVCIRVCIYLCLYLGLYLCLFLRLVVYVFLSVCSPSDCLIGSSSGSCHYSYSSLRFVRVLLLFIKFNLLLFRRAANNPSGG